MQDLISRYQLEEHPEGGHFSRVWTSEKSFSSSLKRASHIYYLLHNNAYSAFHRLQHEELWHHYEGGVVEIHTISEKGELSSQLLGKEKEASPMIAIPPNTWFCAALTTIDSFAFLGCTVVPEFTFSCFEMGDKKELLTLFPQHKGLIERFCKGD